ncbi:MULTISPECIES: hypothetical protein [unclassified Sphingomonas]|uniref:hypothetical protein n=1 Tax=unclassified Sphingomonas TaxID=196159 RepID=UPI0006FD8ED4|nr:MULTISPECIES: hypothetical protein [unclassified Sphingomonas]KQX18052.1 hypothetical protein ASD17_20420 [Sphingomonas sp. Root1294]KQY72607.1 hypothetical protein ASD39_17535 [Sphingomonas sp. Root50]KRB87769.1 hypothetical protein ASE22_24040 [Sphingomonas sp. Root720]
MGAIGWIWAWLMLLGGVRAHLANALPDMLVWGMLLSGLLALPLLWNRQDGVLSAVAPSGVVRGAMAVLILLAVGISCPDAILRMLSA